MARRMGEASGAEDTAGGAYGNIAAVLPLAVGAAAIWFVSEAQGFLLLNLTLFWGGAVLIFFAGICRGEAALAGGGAVAAALWLFAAGFAGLIGTVWAYPMWAVLAEVAGYASLLFLGPALAAGGRSSGRSHLAVAALAILSLAAVAAFIYVSPLV